MRRTRRIFERLLLVGGLIAVDVWIWSHAATELYQRWQERQFEQERTVTRSAPAAAPFKPNVTPNNARLGRIVIPRLHLRAMVREGTEENTLSLAAGHIPHTALPGEKGNVGVAAHRDTLFRGLKDIRKNDLIQFETRTGNFNYRVEATEIVKPEDVSVLKPGPFPELTLVTCYPFHYVGNAPDRFIVKARQVSDDAATAAPEPAKPQPQPRVKKRPPRTAQRASAKRPETRKPRRLVLAAIAQPDSLRPKTARWR